MIIKLVCLCGKPKGRLFIYCFNYLNIVIYIFIFMKNIALMLYGSEGCLNGVMKAFSIGYRKLPAGPILLNCDLDPNLGLIFFHDQILPLVNLCRSIKIYWTTNKSPINL